MAVRDSIITCSHEGTKIKRVLTENLAHLTGSFQDPTCLLENTPPCHLEHGIIMDSWLSAFSRDSETSKVLGNQVHRTTTSPIRQTIQESGLGMACTQYVMTLKS